MAVLPDEEDPDFLGVVCGSDIVLGGAGETGDFFDSAGILWGANYSTVCML